MPKKARQRDAVKPKFQVGQRVLHACRMTDGTDSEYQAKIREITRTRSKPLDAYDSIIARSGNKWDALQYAVRTGEPCAFDGTAGNDVRALFADYCAEPV